MTTAIQDVFHDLPMILLERSRILKDAALSPAGDFVLYWMRHAMRVQENPTLDFAILLANRLGFRVWGVMVLKIALRHPTTQACLDELRRNEGLRLLIGIKSEDAVPSIWNLSRFEETPGKQPYASLLKVVGHDDQTFARCVRFLAGLDDTTRPPRPNEPLPCSQSPSRKTQRRTNRTLANIATASSIVPGGEDHGRSRHLLITLAIKRLAN